MNIFKDKNHQRKWKDFSIFHKYFKAKHKIINDQKYLMQHFKKSKPFQNPCNIQNIKILETNFMYKLNNDFQSKKKTELGLYIFLLIFFP